MPNEPGAISVPRLASEIAAQPLKQSVPGLIPCELGLFVRSGGSSELFGSEELEGGGPLTGLWWHVASGVGR